MKFSVESGTLDWMCLGNFIKGDEWFYEKKKEKIIEWDGWLWSMEMDEIFPIHERIVLCLSILYLV
jgi:hypothetical protein